MRILIPTDFSAAARSAARFAFDLFGPSAEYTLVNAYQTPHAGASVLVSLSDIMKEEAEDGLREETELLYKLFGPNVNLKKEALYGEVTGVIHQLTEVHPFDFVVMGTIGATGIKEVFLGSNTAGSIRQSQVPMLVIPSTWSKTRFDNILLAVDDLEYPKGTFQALTKVTEPKSCMVHLLHVEQEEGEEVNFLSVLNELEAYDCRIHRIEGKKVAKSILEYMDENEIDLICLVNRKHGFWSRIFKKSQTAKVAMHTDVPLLALHDQ